jgi:hypothetical protein
MVDAADVPEARQACPVKIAQVETALAVYGEHADARAAGSDLRPFVRSVMS